MADLVLIPLPGVGTLQLTREQYEAALRPIAPPAALPASAEAMELVTAKVLARQTNYPVSSLYEYARAGIIPCVRVGKTVRFSPAAVFAALRATGELTGGHA